MGARVHTSVAFGIRWQLGDAAVRHQFPQAGELVRNLRDVPCADPACGWCRERHDATRELKRWFGFARFRPESLDEYGEPMQQAIVEAAMRGRHSLAVLPTGTGKSIRSPRCRATTKPARSRW